MLKRILIWLLYALPLWSSAQTLSADSVTQAASTIQEEVTYCYVNATSLTLRARPEATATALATIQGASRVRLLQAQADGWSRVRVATQTGYVKSDYLVEAQEAVTAEVDWAVIEAAGGGAYSQVTSSATIVRAVPTSVYRPSPKVATGPKVFVCGNGRTEVYHTSEACAAMRRCTYQTLVMSQREAQASGLRGCMKCD